MDEPAEGGAIRDQPRFHAGEDRLRLGEPADPALRQRDAPLLVTRTVNVNDERLKAQLEVEPAVSVTPARAARTSAPRSTLVVPLPMKVPSTASGSRSRRA